MTHQDNPEIPGKNKSTHQPTVEKKEKNNLSEKAEENKNPDANNNDYLEYPEESAQIDHIKKDVAEQLLYQIQKDMPERQFKPDDDDDSIMTDKPIYGKNDDDEF